MHLKDGGIKALLQDGAFFRLLMSQGISNLGDSFRFIAVTMLLLKLTGSGVSTSLSLIFSILPSLFLSPFAGTLGDLLPEKYLMALLDFIRGVVVLLFIFHTRVETIFLLMIVLAVLETVYSPLRRKLTVRTAGKKLVLNANSLLTGVSGVAFLIGPFLAGILTGIYGAAPALAIAGISFMASSVLILSIRTEQTDVLGTLQKKNGFLFETRKGFEYVKGNPVVMEVVLIGVVAAFCSVSISIAFYPFSFDVLRLTSQGWSLLISVYYGTNLFAVLLLLIMPQFLKTRQWTVIYAGFGLTALIWAFYGLTESYALVLLLQFIEGTVLAICGIFLATQMQTAAGNKYMARVSGISDIAGGIGRLAGMICSYLIMLLESYKSVLVINSFVLLGFVLFRLVRPNTGVSMGRRGKSTSYY